MCSRNSIFQLTTCMMSQLKLELGNMSSILNSAESCTRDPFNTTGWQTAHYLNVRPRQLTLTCSLVQQEIGLIITSLPQRTWDLDQLLKAILALGWSLVNVNGRGQGIRRKEEGEDVAFTSLVVTARRNPRSQRNPSSIWWRQTCRTCLVPKVHRNFNQGSWMNSRSLF